MDRFDRNFSRELDNYIMGVNIHSQDDVLHKCPKCGGEKRIPMFYELGGWFYNNDDDPFCDKCQCEMEIVEGNE